jgi:hypothetical protein
MPEVLCFYFKKSKSIPKPPNRAKEDTLKMLIGVFLDAK